LSNLQVSESKGVRYLHFGSPWVQGAMRIARPWALELEYTRDMMLPLMLRGSARWPASVLQIGLGSASITKFLHKHHPDARLSCLQVHRWALDWLLQARLLPDHGPVCTAVAVCKAFDPGRWKIPIGIATRLSR